jgi:hypothetical protein
VRAYLSCKLLENIRKPVINETDRNIQGGHLDNSASKSLSSPIGEELAEVAGILPGVSAFPLDRPSNVEETGSRWLKRSFLEKRFGFESGL